MIYYKSSVYIERVLMIKSEEKLIIEKLLLFTLKTLLCCLHSKTLKFRI